MKLWISTAALLLALTACGGSDDGGGGGDTENAMDVATQIQGDVDSVTKVVEITENNDPNESIGRPDQYTQAVSIYDSRADCVSELDVSCGAKLELWPDEDAAKKRADFIDSAAEGMPALAEYHYFDGGMLLRVAGTLTPTQAKEYEAAFTG